MLSFWASESAWKRTTPFFYPTTVSVVIGSWQKNEPTFRFISEHQYPRYFLLVCIFHIMLYFFYLSHRENSSRPYKYLLKQRIEDGVTHKNAHKHIHPCTTERACGCPRAYRYAASFIPGFSRPVWRVSRASTMQRSHCVLAAVQLQGYTYFSSYVTYQCEVFSYIKLNSLSTR